MPSAPVDCSLTYTCLRGVAFELVKVRRQLEFSIAAAKGIVIVKPPNTWESVKDIFRTRGPMGIYTGWPLHMRKYCRSSLLFRSFRFRD